MAFFLALKFIDNSMEQMFEERKRKKMQITGRKK